MNDNAKRWVEALRSGKYEQGKNGLRTKDKFCCLGVACDIYDNTIWDKLPENLGRLPSYVREWLDLSHDEGEYKGSYLTNDNDIKNKSFEEIADIIESEPEGLFVNDKSSNILEILRWLELDDRTNVDPISEDDAQENCKPFPNNVVSVTTIPPESV